MCISKIYHQNCPKNNMKLPSYICKSIHLLLFLADFSLVNQLLMDFLAKIEHITHKSGRINAMFTH